MWAKTCAALLVLSCGVAGADESAAPPIKSLSELISRCEEELAGRVTRPEPKKPGDKPTGAEPKADLAARDAEARKLAQRLLTEELDEASARGVRDQLVALAVPDVAAYISPLLTGSATPVKQKVAWELLIALVPEVYKGEAVAARMVPFGETHGRYRTWCADRLRNPHYEKSVRTRVSEVVSLVNKLENADAPADVAQYKAQIMVQGEEIAALMVIRVLERRVNLPDKKLTGSEELGTALTELFTHYAVIDIDGMREKAFAKRGRGDNWRDVWRDVLRDASEQLVEKIKACPYNRTLAKFLR